MTTASPTATREQFLIDEIHALGVTHTASGVDIKTLSYERLQEELIHAAFRKIDIESDANRWF